MNSHIKKLFSFIFLFALGLMFFQVNQRARTADTNVIHDRVEAHQVNLAKVDESWRNIKLGNEFYNKEDYLAAKQYYKKAYEAGGEKAVSGLKLADAYIKLNQYEEAAMHLNKMIVSGQLSEKGTENANLLLEFIKKQQEAVQAPTVADAA